MSVLILQVKYKTVKKLFQFHNEKKKKVAWDSRPGQWQGTEKIILRLSPQYVGTLEGHQGDRETIPELLETF